MKWWAIYKNLPVDVVVRLPLYRSRNSQGQETFWEPSGVKKTHKNDSEWSNHHPSVSTHRPKGLSHSKMKYWAIYTNLPVDVLVRLPHDRSRDTQGQETVWAPSAVRKTHKNDTEWSNHHPSVSTHMPKGLSHSKMKWWAIYTNLPVDVIVTPPHPRRRDSQGQETFLAPSADKQTRNYDTQCSIHHPTLSTVRPKGLSHSKMKWWAIYTNLQVDVIVRLPHPQSRDSQDQETFLTLSPDKLILNYDTECSNPHHSLSTPRPKGLSRSKMKWWAISINLPVDVIVRLPHDRSRDSQGQETFLALYGEKQTCNYDTQCSIHHPTLSTLRPKGLSHSKMKWWAIYINLPVDVRVRLPHPRRRDSQGHETFPAPPGGRKTRNYHTQCSNNDPFLSTPRLKAKSIEP